MVPTTRAIGLVNANFTTGLRVNGELREPLGNIESNACFVASRLAAVALYTANMTMLAHTRGADSGVLEPRVLEPSEISIFRRPDEAV